VYKRLHMPSSGKEGGNILEKKQKSDTVTLRKKPGKKKNVASHLEKKGTSEDVERKRMNHEKAVTEKSRTKVHTKMAKGDHNKSAKRVKEKKCTWWSKEWRIRKQGLQLTLKCKNKSWKQDPRGNREDTVPPATPVFKRKIRGVISWMERRGTPHPKKKPNLFRLRSTGGWVTWGE